MLVLKTVLLVVGGILAVSAGICFWLSYLLEHPSSATGETRARLVQREHRKNVKIYGVTHHRTIPQQVMFLKHLSKGLYEYTVNGKTYRIKETHYGTPQEQPLMLTVVYLRRSPRIACPEFSIPRQLFYAILLTVWAVPTFLFAFSIG